MLLSSRACCWTCGWEFTPCKVGCLCHFVVWCKEIPYGNGSQTSASWSTRRPRRRPFSFRGMTKKLAATGSPWSHCCREGKGFCNLPGGITMALQRIQSLWPSLQPSLHLQRTVKRGGKVASFMTKIDNFLSFGASECPLRSARYNLIWRKERVASNSIVWNYDKLW